jgi:hypothetical protein
MARISALFTAIVSLSVVFATPIIEIREPLISVPIVARMNMTGAKNFVESQRARAAQLIASGRELEAMAHGGKSKRGIVGNVPVTNEIVCLNSFHTLLAYFSIR